MPKAANVQDCVRLSWVKGRNDCWKAKVNTWTVNTVKGCGHMFHWRKNSRAELAADVRRFFKAPP